MMDGAKQNKTRMNKDAAISDFVKKNYKYLTSNDFNTKQIKGISKKYFVDQNKKRFGIPSLQEIRIALVKYLRKNGIAQSRIEEYMQVMPIFSNISERDKKILIDLITDHKYDSIFAPEDINILQNVDAFHAAKEHLAKDIDNQFKERIDAFEKIIEQKQEDYNSLPSILDVETIPEPDYNPSVEAETLWWERLYLKDNPFPRKDGLSAVDEDLYESVVVKTAPFVKILNATRDNIAYILNTAFLLVGDYGYGKTTFMDYLSYYLIHKNILPLRITCGRPFPDIGGFSHNFYLSLQKILKDEVRNTSIVSDTILELDIEDQIVFLCEKVLNKFVGIVVFLDDYHKHQSSYEAIYEFLGSLQILKDKLVRKKLSVGFITSGVQEWKNELLRNSQMSGFFDSGIIEMAEITAKSVCDVFNQRIKAYCYDKNPRQVQLNFVRNIFKKAKGKAGYRDYLNFIISELENNNYAVVNTPIDVSQEELDSIKVHLERNNALSAALNKLIYESKFKKYTSEQVGKCLEILVQISLHKGFTENDVLFRENKHYFQRLKDSQFLQKQRINKNEFKWVVRSDFQRTFDEIDSNFNKSISDYILKLYGGRNYHKLASNQQDTEPVRLKELKRFFATVEEHMDKSSRGSLSMGIQMFDSVKYSDIGNCVSDRSQNAAQQAMDSISLALFGTDGMLSLYNEAGITENEMRWRFHWLENESVTEYYKCENNYLHEPNQLNYERLIRQVNDTFPSIAECLKNVLQDICKPLEGSVCCFACPVRHTDQERILFSIVRDNYYAADRASHFRYVEKVTDHLEERFRLFLYITTSLLFGVKNINDIIPPAIKIYATKNKERRTNYASFFNPFNGLTRPQFRELFLSTEQIKKFIINELDLRWQTRDWEIFFNIFIDENISTSHKQVDSYSHSERDKYLQYCKMARFLSSELNTFIKNIITNNSFILTIDRMSLKNIEDAIFKYSFKMNKKYATMPSTEEKILNLESQELYRQDDLFEHSLSSDIYNKVILNIQSKLGEIGIYLEDLMDVDYITSTYNVYYCQFLSALTYATYIDKIIKIYPWHGSSILIKNALKSKY